MATLLDPTAKIIDLEKKIQSLESKIDQLAVPTKWLGNYATLEILISTCKDIAKNGDFAYVLDLNEGIRTKYLYQDNEFVKVYTDQTDIDDYYVCDKFITGGTATEDEATKIIKIFMASGTILAHDSSGILMIFNPRTISGTNYYFLGETVSGTTVRRALAIFNSYNNKITLQMT